MFHIAGHLGIVEMSLSLEAVFKLVERWVCAIKLILKLPEFWEVLTPENGFNGEVNHPT